MNKYNLIEEFFNDQEDYISFLLGNSKRILANDEGTCFAELTKEDECYIYKLTWLADGKFIGDYVKPFKATEDNVNTFNEGCKILAERLSIYIETGNVNLVPIAPPVFKHLTEVK
jgi:hypothetical protein